MRQIGEEAASTDEERQRVSKQRGREAERQRGTAAEGEQQRGRHVRGSAAERR